MTKMTEKTITLYDEDKTFKKVSEFMAKISVKSTEDPKIFIVSYPKKVMPRSVEAIFKYLAWFYFMAQIREEARTEDRKKRSYVS